MYKYKYIHSLHAVVHNKLINEYQDVCGCNNTSKRLMNKSKIITASRAHQSTGEINKSLYRNIAMVPIA